MRAAVPVLNRPRLAMVCTILGVALVVGAALWVCVVTSPVLAMAVAGFLLLALAMLLVP